MSSAAIAWVFGLALGGYVIGVHVLVEVVVLEADPAFALGVVRKRRRALGGRHVGEGRDIVVVLPRRARERMVGRIGSRAATSPTTR